MSIAQPLFSTQEGAASYFKCAAFYPTAPAESDSYVDSAGKLVSQKDWSDRRTNILRAAFEKMANGKSYVNHRTVNNFLNATAKQIQQDYQKVFGKSTKGDVARVSFADFLSCYQRLANGQSEDEFVYEIECSFEIKEEWYTGDLLLNEEDLYVASFLRALREKSRQKAGKENSTVHILRNAFRLKDDEGARLVTLKQWTGALVSMGFQLQDAENEGLYNRFKNKEGLVNYEEVIRKMFPTAL